MTTENQNRDQIQKKILNEIRNRYLFAVTLIASFTLLTFAVNQTLNRRMKEDFKTINLSGRQRMLSQRIALLSLRGETAARQDAVHKFSDGLEFLLKTRFLDPAYSDVQAIYEGEDGLEAQSREFLELARAPESAIEKEKIFVLSQDLLYKYEAVTFLKQHISEAEFRNTLVLEILLLLLNLLILTFEIIFIFRPITGRLKNTFSELNRIEEQSFLSSRLALIGEIASSIGHEIKNPLFALQLYASKISDADKPEERANIQDRIEKNTDRVLKIIKALSTQAREASQDKMEDTSLTQIIEDALEMFIPKIKYGNIHLQKVIHFDGPIKCRHAAISQVIANLIANAIDSVNESGLENKSITLESGQDIDGIYVRVQDSGAGVPEELKEKIFESFITTKKQGKGTGLGLPISKRIMQEHNGSLSLNTDISRSCFELRFPAA